MSDYLNRVDAIQDTTSGTTTLAEYSYLGAGMVVRITYPEPSVWLDLWGGTSGVFAGLDQFNRVIDQRWQNNITTTPTDIDRFKYGHDRNSNRLWKANVVGTAAVTAGLDEFYPYDSLNRLTAMQRGVLNGTNTGITGTPSVEQDWTLDPVGNWSGFVTKASGTTDLNQTRTANKVNEITNITESTGPTWIVPAYDAAGNTIAMPQPAAPTSSFAAVYDAWNRMVSISAGTTLVAKYQYDGRKFRIVKGTYTGGTLSETRHFFFTSNWQDIEERVGMSTAMDKQYVWGVRYVDELVCRDDATPQRLYATQDANFNVTSIANASGAVQERYLFDPYGIRAIMNPSWGVVGSGGYDWTIGFQGLTHDVEVGLIYVRWRLSNALLGRPLQRDPAGYYSGVNTYQFVGSRPISRVDPMGLIEGEATKVCGRWKAGAGCTPHINVTLFPFVDEAPNAPFTNSILRWLFGSIGSHPVSQTAEFQIAVTTNYQINFDVAGNTKTPDAATGEGGSPDSSTVFTAHASTSGYGLPYNKLLQTAAGRLVGAVCRKSWVLEAQCFRCCDTVYSIGEPYDVEPGPTEYATGYMQAETYGTLQIDHWSPFGVYCDAPPPIASCDDICNSNTGSDVLRNKAMPGKPDVPTYRLS